VIVIYYGLLQLGDGLIQASVVSVGWGVWLPNTVVGLLAVVFLWRDNLSLRGGAAANRQQAPVRQAQGQRLRFLRVQRHVLRRYVTRSYVQMLSYHLPLLLTGYLLVDILERLEWFARYHADTLKALQFYCLRLPLLTSRIVPMSFLLATTLTVSTLSAHRELIGMRTCGVSVVRALVPILLIAGLVAPAYFLLNEVVAPKTNALAEQFKKKKIKNRIENTGPLSHMIWYRAGSHVYQADQLDSQLANKEISIYTPGQMGCR
jgi:lipopolysaccharide export LptBFGC system permease protein LptF